MGPLIVSGPAPAILPARPMPFRPREGRPLYVLERDVELDGWRIPRGYVTDFGSIPGLASLLTLLRLQPLGRHAWAALGHDWRYAIGEPGEREDADDAFLRRMKVDGVAWLDRQAMHRAVRLGGSFGYRRAKTWWDTENFVDPDTGLPVPAPFRREDAFREGPFGRAAY